MPLTIRLPWPAAALSPNSRDRWAQIRAKKAAKNYAWGMTKALMPAQGIAYKSWAGPVHVTLTFHPAMDRARDLDNLIASHKAALDGIASALGVDDSKFSLSASIGENRKPAEVVITLEPSIVTLENRGPVS